MKITISFDLETFEFSVSAKFVLMTKCLQDFSQFLSFYWHPGRVNFDSSPFCNYILKTDPTFTTE